MRKKRILGIFVIFLILMSFSLLQAQTNSTEEQEKVDEAYSCLTDKVEEECDSLTTEEKIFSLLAINKCKTELIEDSSDEECWPSEDCELKTTAQAVLALDNVATNTDDAKEWLLSHKRTPSELIWYLQIESSGQTTCTIGYTGFSNDIDIGEDKKIIGDAGQCLPLAQDDYWLEVSSDCYDEEFSVSCDQDFSTTLLFQKKGSDTIHIFQKTSSAAAGGTITEKIESSCFREGELTGDLCKYEGSLWAALALDSLGEDVSSSLPYLITLAEDNDEFLPDAFLYLITDDEEYSDSLLSKQKKIGDQYYWQESLDKYYDTALALFPFKYQTFIEKTNSKQWLLEEQDDDGCWSDNIRNTAFILASIWPRDFGGGGGGVSDCLSEEYYCVNKGSCEGQVLDYYCPGVLTECCTLAPEQQTCTEAGGNICSQRETCPTGNTIVGISGLLSGEVCCAVDCQETPEPTVTECEQNDGVCRPSCLDDEEEESYDCEFLGDVCCVEKTTTGGSYTWIWILLILIVLVVIGIIFRDKLRNLWFRIKSKSRGKPGPRPGPPRRPPGPPHYPARRPIRERRILPSLQQPVRPGRAPSRSQKELDQVLRKLKQMGK